MPRPRKFRKVCFHPRATYFKPAGIRLAYLEEITLSFDELEALRLVDFKGIDQVKAGEKMKISQSTLSRLLKTGRKKVADAITNSKAIKIQGGAVKLSSLEHIKATKE